MAKRKDVKIEIEFNLPNEDKERMDRIIDACGSLMTMGYQNAYDELAEEQKEKGFEILERRFREEYGEGCSLGIVEGRNNMR